ncbi:hypothetical protein NQT62_11675 [Limnobacter humi]|uniref:Uncharacterized protein n=1 Tax=Limnobacter humi TaxID=1778671 RepID=A0ABT1WHU1_9BURK|nr:hypothetical protein [Limnobacter humi]MCQ8897093.1 hypothetical protein [Limnobacter humi]
MYTNNLDRVAVSPEVAGMLYLRGAGNLADLHQAMMRDGSGTGTGASKSSVAGT